MIWTRLRLELARSPDHPEGSHRIAYELTLPIGADGRFEPRGFHQMPQLCTVHRYREDSDDRVGTLRHHPGDHWVFAYGGADPMEEGIPRLGSHRFEIGDYISVLDGEHAYAFRIVSAGLAPVIAHATSGAQK